MALSSPPGKPCASISLPLLAPTRSRTRRSRAELHHDTRECLLYVTAVARGYYGRGLELDELIAAGNLGLVEASLRFDPDRGVKFLTYAGWWIRKMILQALAEQSGPVRLPRYQQEKLRALQSARADLRIRSGLEPDRDALADRSGLSRAEVEQLQQLVIGAISLEQPSSPESSRTLKEVLADAASECPQGSVVRRDLTGLVRRHLDRLSPRERKVLTWRYGLDGEPTQTLRDVGRRLQISRESVRQVEMRALRKLKQRMRPSLAGGRGGAGSVSSASCWGTAAVAGSVP